LTITADSKSKEYGAANPSFTVTYTSLTNGDTSASLGGTLSFGAPAQSSAVGTYSGQIVPSGITSPNYTITYVNGTLTVTAAGTSVTASALPEPSTAGNVDTLSATVTTTVTGGIDPNNEGTVTFAEGLTTLCTTPVLAGNSASCTFSGFTVLVHSITATYNPSANFQTSSATFPHQVN